MDIFDSSYYRLNKLLLSSLGFWPYQTGISKIFPYTVMILGTISFCIPQVIYLLKNCKDLDKVYNSLPMFCATLILMSKVAVMTYNLPKLKTTLDQIQYDWNSFMDTKEEEILRKYAENSKKITQRYLTFVAVPVVCFTLWPLAMPVLDFVVPLNKSRPRYLIHPAEYFVDHERYYYAILMDEYYGYTISLTTGVACDTMYFLFMEHVHGSFAILCYHIDNIWIGSTGNNPECSEKIKETICQRVINCIQLHGKIMKYIQCILSTYTMYLLLDVGAGLLTHSAMCVIIMLNMSNPSRVIQFAIIICAQSCRLFLNSWTGQKLIDNSSHIYMAAYKTAWYKWPIKARKMLLFFIIRNQVPCTINFGGLYIVRYDSFATVMKTSLSYCMVMASLND